MVFMLALLLLAALWSHGAMLVAAPLVAGGRCPRLRRIAPLVALPLLAGAQLTPGPILPRLRTAASDPTGLSRRGGYWGATAVALFGGEPDDASHIAPPSAERLAEEYWAMVYPDGRPQESGLPGRLALT